MRAENQARRHGGGGGGARGAHASPQEPKRSACCGWDRKILKMMQKQHGDRKIDNFNAFPAV